MTMSAGNVLPAGWLPCDGRTLLIAQHPALFLSSARITAGTARSIIACPFSRAYLRPACH
ncbi:tail fiber protein [Burkholderia gladioli]|nr:phage tail protein [Burkholderia gladioli]QPQ87877.1 tail fiber protein [Burkholderia gladioli]